MRTQNLPILPPVAEFTVAPHRYLYTELVGAEALLGLPEPTFRQVKEAAPYRAGDVVYAVYGDSFAKVYIHYVAARVNQYGDKVEYYIARRETKEGQWSKRTYECHPGYIQKGYQRAGLAPEMPADA